MWSGGIEREERYLERKFGDEYIDRAAAHRESLGGGL
jgi:protein-S-isoprenylcysteine O-methyltransferase Ste14